MEKSRQALEALMSKWAGKSDKTQEEKEQFWKDVTEHLQQAQLYVDTISVQEAAEFVRVSTTTIRNWVRKGDLIPVKFKMFRAVRFREADVTAVSKREKLKGGRGRKRP